jgi:hypothetical protein
MGNQNASVQRLRGRTSAGQVAGPAIHPAGFIEGKSAFSSRNGHIFETLQAGLDAVDWYAARGLCSIKLYNSIKPEWVKPLAARVRAQGLRVSGDVLAHMRAEEAVRASCEELTHINEVMLNFVVRPGNDTRTLVRFERVGGDGHDLDLQSPKAKAFLRLLPERGTAVAPTLGAFEAMFTQSQGQRWNFTCKAASLPCRRCASAPGTAPASRVTAAAAAASGVAMRSTWC